MHTDHNYVKDTLEEELRSTRLFLAEIQRRIVLDETIGNNEYDEAMHLRWLSKETKKEANIVVALEKLERETVA